MTAKPQAPTLFGKRMRPSLDGGWEWTRGNMFVHVCPRTGPGWMWRFSVSYLLVRTGVDFRAPETAARDAERYLTRLHRALGKVVGSEGK